MSTDFKLTPHPEYIHVELAPGYEIRPEAPVRRLRRQEAPVVDHANRITP